MAVFRIERTRDYTVMSNHHLRNANLSLKAKGLLSMMLSLPEDWNYTTRGLAKICKEGVDAIGAALRELEGAGYIVRHQRRDKSGRITDTEYVIYEQPQPDMSQPDTASPDTENPDMVKPDTEKPAELNIEKSNTEKSITYGSSTDSIPFRETAAARPPERKGRDAMSVTEIENYRELILENIEYDCLKQRYVCSRNRMVRGKHCEYKAMLKKTDIEPMVIEAIREIVRNEEYAQAIKKRIGVQIDTKAVDKELEGYQAKLKEVDLNKTRLEREIDSLPVDAKYRERKLHDMTLRLDSLYDVIVELEEKIEDARLRRDAIKQQAITLENIYKIMVNFDCVYNIINDEEKRNVVTALIKEIEIYRNDESEYPLKRIGLNFPVFKDGGEVTELLWDKGNTVDTCAILYKKAGGGAPCGSSTGNM